ncbi:methyl-accepting chemotaxis protein [uncultured Dechloromonas sp.]|uniref:methyl-accepting chemotaxis protein n=1 Tax=uncultured Dechloromonas sp. TaxID=171719 RepID=UPI0025E9CE00|nr:methyl-accepting chemotaxis protein [uncultured Dechloromonas sp.]
MGLSGLRVSTRIYVLIGLTLLGLLTLCVITLFQLKDNMLEDRKAKVRNLVEYAHTQLAYYEEQARSGKLPLEQAQLLAQDSLRKARYDEKEYFWINDFHPRTLMHPIKPELEGKDQTDNKDVNGKQLYVEFVKVVKANGAGFVDYYWSKPGDTKPVPKLSYVKGFAPWGWIVGTGIYIDDVDQQFRQSAMLLGGISLFLLLTLVLIGWQISSSILRQLGGEPQAASEIMQRVAGGDLTARLDKMPEGSLLHSLGNMVGSLHRMVSGINADAAKLVANAEHIARASDEVAKAAEHQADSTSAMAAAIEELTVSSNHISDSAHETARETSEAAELAAQGSERVMQASTAIEKIASTVSDASGRIHALEERAKQVSTIASVIKDIAGQTNLLALNAAIEAARAGEQGRGFAVVADEVRKLAERTSSATLEIEQMIGGIQADTVGAVEAMNAALPEVQEGVQLASSASDSLLAIEDSARRTLERVGEVADATKEQSSASTSIAQRVEQIANMVEETTATIRGTTESAHELESIAGNLRELVGQFKT